jgi:DNA (cytosine-5)-methyltransferase 1
VRYLSVCSGIEAASAAWHDLGWRPLAFSEIEPFPSAVLAQRFPGVPNWGDMTKFKEWPNADVDVLVGGTPCQSFSVAGLRKGLDDPRGSLMLTFLAIAARYRPRYVVWENVPGVLSSNGGRDFGSFLGALGQLGYGWAYRVLDAQWFGVAQRRRRVFVVGCLGDQRGSAQVLFESESVRRDPAPRREAGQRPAPSLAARTRGGGGLGTDAELDGALIAAIDGELNPCGDVMGPVTTGAAHHNRAPMIASTGSVSHCPNAGGMNRQDCETETLIAHALRAEGFDASEDGTGRGTPLVPVVSSGHGWWAESDGTAQTLRAQDSITKADTLIPVHAFDASEDGTGRGTPLVPVAFHPTQDPISSVDGTTHAMGTGSKGGVATVAVAFTAKDHGADAGHLAPTLRAMGHGASHANGGGQVAVAFQPRIARNGRGDMGDLVNALQAQSGGTGKGDAAPCVAAAMQVRRLTPRECERLQGFADDWTLIPWRGRPAAECPDGPRYKALGNSMAVPCMRWIGERIAAIESQRQAG